MNYSKPAAPLRILQITGPMNRGGIESWLMNLLRHVDRRELSIDIMTTGQQEAVYDAEIQALGAALLRCPSPDKPWVFIPKFRRLLSEHGPYDAVHSHLHHFSGLPLYLARQAGIPIRVSTSHLDTSSLDQHAAPLRRLYLTLMRAAVLRNSTDRLAVGEGAAAALYGADWRQRGGKIVRLGLNLEPLKRLDSASSVRQELNLPLNEPLLINVSRLAVAKNHRFLLEVFQAYRASHQQGQLLLAGDGPLRSELERYAQELKVQEYVHFLGSRSDVPALLKMADVFVFPSLFEGLSLAIVEAQVAGLPCVVARHLTPESELPSAHYFRPSLEEGVDGWVAALELALAAGPSQADGSAFDIVVNAQDLGRLYGA